MTDFNISYLRPIGKTKFKKNPYMALGKNQIVSIVKMPIVVEESIKEKYEDYDFILTDLYLEQDFLEENQKLEDKIISVREFFERENLQQEHYEEFVRFSVNDIIGYYNELLSYQEKHKSKKLIRKINGDSKKS